MSQPTYLEHKSQVVCRSIEVLRRRGLCVALNLSGAWQEPARLGLRCVESFAPPEFPISQYIGGRMVLSFITAAPLPESYWAFVTEEALNAHTRDEIGRRLGIFAADAGVPWESCCVAQAYFYLLGDAESAKNALSRSAAKPLTRTWLLPLAECWAQLFGDLEEARRLVDRQRPASDSLYDEAHFARARQRLGLDSGEEPPVIARIGAWIVAADGGCDAAAEFIGVEDANRLLSSIEKLDLSNEVLLRLANAWRLLARSEEDCRRVLDIAGKREMSWIECVRLAVAWVNLLGDRPNAVPILRKGLDDTSSYVALVELAKTWMELLDDADGFESMLEAKLPLFDEATGWVELARLRWETYGHAAGIAELLERAEKLAESSYDYECLAKAWRECIGDESRAELMEGWRQRALETELEEMDPLKG